MRENMAKNKKKVAYIAGPYRDRRGAWFMRQNIERARAVAAKLWELGYVVICPHANSAYFDGIVSDEVFLAGGIELLKRSDIVFLAPGWGSSAGTLAEIRVARKMGLDVYIWGGGILSSRAYLGRKIK